ncbi:MAG: hypothetical protein HOW73_46705 [Polyangiaceae bacterium]|nr:hypothetical protein [Polyangiaceae bacterium]
MLDDASSGEADRDLAAALHEVGNGLTVVLGWLEEAQAQGASGPVAEAVKIALERARRAQRIARRAIGADPSRPGVEPLRDIVSECIGGLTPVASKKRVSIHSAYAAGLDAGNVEAGERLLQVLTNLLLNALDVTKEGGDITVRIAKDNDPGLVGLSVEDGGPGIPDADRAGLFRRGQTSKADGAGIGLAHAQAIALEEGGRLSVQPFEQGHGAVFEIAWPLSATSSANGPRTRRAVSLHGCRIAVVDDDTGILELLDMVFSARGAAVRSFARHADFMTALRSSAFDVAFLDASPYGSGLQDALKSLKSAHPSLDLILISGASDPGISVSKLGVMWIRKPFEVDEVIDVVRLIRASSRTAE